MATAVQEITETRAGAHAAAAERVGAPYMNPYLAGIGLGLVLLSAFVVMGRGLGASGAINSTLAWALSKVAPAWVAGNEFLGPYLGDGSTHPLKDWLVFEVMGIYAGALVSGLLAGRFKVMVERGPRISASARLGLAFAGGTMTGIGAAFGRGCTSGQALTGGSLLNLGSWIFMICVFAGAYTAAYFVRRQWR